MRGEELLHGQGMTGSGPLRYNLQPELRLPRSQLSALPARPGCFSSFLVTSLQSNAHAGGELSPYAILQYAAVFLQYDSSQVFAVDEKVGGDLLYPVRCWKVSVPFWQMLYPTHS